MLSQIRRNATIDSKTMHSGRLTRALLAVRISGGENSFQLETTGFNLPACSLRNLANFGEITIWQYG